jgi:hypothetical protein
MHRNGHPPAGHHRAVVRVGFLGIGRSTPMPAKMVARQSSSGGSRPLPIGSRSIGVSLQPAVPRRVAPQQSPLPLHQSPTIVTQFQSSEAIKCAAHLHCGRSPGRARRLHRQPECHLYFAHRVSFLCCADTVCRRPIKMSLLCQLEMTLPGGFPGGVWGDGSADERWGAGAARGAA